MSGNGITTSNLPPLSYFDSLVANADGSTGAISAAAVVAQIVSRIGPSYETRTQLYNDVDWPAGAVAAVYGDIIAARIGTYVKTAATGLAGWDYIGDLPITGLSQTLLDSKASNSDLQAVVGGSLAAGDWDASAGSYPANSVHGTFYHVSVAGTQNGVTFAVGDRLYPLRDNANTGFYVNHWTVVKLSLLPVPDVDAAGVSVAPIGSYTPADLQAALVYLLGLWDGEVELSDGALKLTGSSPRIRFNDSTSGTPVDFELSANPSSDDGTGQQPTKWAVQRVNDDGTYITAILVDETGAVTFPQGLGGQIASQADAEALTNNTLLMTPLRTGQAIAEATGNFADPAYESSEQLFVSGAQVAVAHSLGRVPGFYQVYLRCISANNGYPAGAEINISGMVDGDGTRGYVTWATDTHITAFFDQAAIQNTEADYAIPTASNWRMVFKAW